MQQLSHIGTTETVDLPDYGLSGVLAKVDTGADSSAIWASNIAEIDGQLCFSLFGISFPLYTGEIIRCKKYSLVSVKNSFGQSEVRYKVTIRLKIADKIIKTKMTLANRANNRYPILIGRRTLKGRFLVDVSRRTDAGEGRRLLMLSTLKTGHAKALTDCLANDNQLDITSLAYNELIFRAGPSGVTINVASSGEDIADYQLTYFRNSRNWGNWFIAATVARYLAIRHRDFVDHAVDQCPDQAKIYQYVNLADNHIRVPQTIFVLGEVFSQSYDLFAQELGLPFIVKDNNGRKGKNNWLISNKAEFDLAISSAAEQKILLLAQQYIPSDGDYRLLVLGGQVTIVSKRRPAHGHLSNVSAGGKATAVDPSSMDPVVTNMAVAAAKLHDLQISGVDFIQDKASKIWYCLEVNKSPEVSSGAFVADKQAALAKYLQQRLQ